MVTELYKQLRRDYNASRFTSECSEIEIHDCMQAATMSYNRFIDKVLRYIEKGTCNTPLQACNHTEAASKLLYFEANLTQLAADAQLSNKVACKATKLQLHMFSR